MAGLKQYIVKLNFCTATGRRGGLDKYFLCSFYKCMFINQRRASRVRLVIVPFASPGGHPIQASLRFRGTELVCQRSVFMGQCTLHASPRGGRELISLTSCAVIALTTGCPVSIRVHCWPCHSSTGTIRASLRPGRDSICQLPSLPVAGHVSEWAQRELNSWPTGRWLELLTTTPLGGIYIYIYVY